MLYNNVIGKVIRKELETLSYEETTYNFEVEDNHNYYVSEECVLVHNECHHVISNKGKKGEAIAEKVRKKYGSVDLNEKRNLVYIHSHKGRHTNAYHKMVEDAVDDIITRIDDIDDFYNEIERLGQLIRENAGCLNKKGKNLCNDVKDIFLN